MRIDVAMTLIVVSLCLPATAQDRGIGGTASASNDAQKYAIIIGVNEYEDEGISDLNYAAADAEAVYEMLKSAPGGFEERRMVLLADGQDEQHEPTRGTALRYLKTYIGLAGPDDTILVYFAGHGTTVDDNLYLLPADASLALVGETGIAFATLKRMLEESPAKRRILLLDACHSGTGRSTDTLSEDAYQRLADESEGTVVLSSCGPNELSHEMAQTGHGAFTYFLLQGLTGKVDANGDGFVGASELSTYTWDHTRLWAAQQGLTQTPWRMEKVAGEIVLAKAGGRVPATQKASASPGLSADKALQGTAVDSDIVGKSSDGRFAKYASGLILDSRLGLEWIVGPDKDTDWNEARAWVEGLTVAGGGWRMPTQEEVKALFQRGVGTRNMDPLFETSGWWVWSGDTEGSSAWHFGFRNGGYWCPPSRSYQDRAFAVRTRR